LAQDAKKTPPTEIPHPRFRTFHMLSRHFSVHVLLVAVLIPWSSLGVSLKLKDSAADLVQDTDASIVHTLNHGLWSSASSRSNEAFQSVKENDKDDEDVHSLFGTEAEVRIRQTVGNVMPSPAFVKAAGDELSKLSAASAQELNTLGDLYIKMNSKVDPEFLRKLKAETPQIMHQLHMNSPMYFPHMHVANHRVVSSADDEMPLTDKSAEAFAGKQSVFEDDRVTLSLVCFVLVVLSAFFNMRRNCKRALPGGHNHHDAGTSPDDKLLSVWDGTISTFSAILGMGFLSLPYTMSLAGWIAAPLMILFSGLTGYTAHLLVWVLQDEVQKANRLGRPAVPGWGFLLCVAYGPKAERFVNVFLVVELWGYVLSGIVATAMNLNMLVDEISVSSAVGLTVLVQFVLTNVPMKTLTRINLISNALFIICCFMFIVTGLLLPSKAPSSELKYVKPEGILAACGIIVFSPCGHSLYPTIMHRMERPEQFPICLKRAYFLACIAYVAFAVPGYYLFGDAAQPSAVRNIGADLNLVPLPNLGWMNSVAAFCMVMKMSGLQPLILTPFNSTIELMLEGKAPKSVSATLIPPVVLTISAVVAMHFANQMATLLNIVGSIFCMSIAFVLPVLCYWKLQERVPGMQQVIFFCLIVMGGTFALLGLMTALST